MTEPGPEALTRALIEAVLSGGGGTGPAPGMVPAMWHIIPVPDSKTVVVVIRDPTGVKVTFCDPQLAANLAGLFEQAAQSARSGITVAPASANAWLPTNSNGHGG